MNGARQGGVPGGVAKGDPPPTFAWRVRSHNRARVFLAVGLAGLLTVIAGRFLEVGVPSRIQPDAPFLPSVKVLPVTGDSNPALVELLRKGNVPSLGSDEILLETPYLDDLLAQIDLNEPVPRAWSLIEAPELPLDRLWPSEEGGELALPKAPDRELAPASPRPLAGEWRAHLKAIQPADSPLLPEAAAFPWKGELPLSLRQEFNLVIDPEGSLVLAFPEGEIEESTATQFRKLLQQWVLSHSSASGDRVGGKGRAIIHLQPAGGPE